MEMQLKTLDRLRKFKIPKILSLPLLRSRIEFIGQREEAEYGFEGNTTYKFLGSAASSDIPFYTHPLKTGKMS